MTRDDEYISAKEVTKLFHCKPTACAVYKWMRVGVFNRAPRRKGLRRITLKCVKDGGSIYTTIAWVNEFKAAVDSNAPPIQQKRKRG